MPFSQKKILAIDDAPSIRTFLRISLQAQGALFSEAGTAESGLEICKREKPDLVVLDLGLPDGDGLDLLAKIKQEDEENSSPVVIILSVRKDPQTKDEAFQLGADAYVTKPFLMEELVEVILQKLEPEVHGDSI